MIGIGLAIAFLLNPPEPPTPHLVEIYLFPHSQEYLDQELKRAREFTAWLALCEEVFPLQENYKEMRLEIESRMDCYGQLMITKGYYLNNNPYLVIVYLKHIRKMIGYEAYYSGRLPPIIPIEFYRRVLK